MQLNALAAGRGQRQPLTRRPRSPASARASPSPRRGRHPADRTSSTRRTRASWRERPDRVFGDRPARRARPRPRRLGRPLGRFHLVPGERPISGVPAVRPDERRRGGGRAGRLVLALCQGAPVGPSATTASRSRRRSGRPPRYSFERNAPRPQRHAPADVAARLYGARLVEPRDRQLRRAVPRPLQRERDRPRCSPPRTRWTSRRPPLARPHRRSAQHLGFDGDIGGFLEAIVAPTVTAPMRSSRRGRPAAATARGRHARARAFGGSSSSQARTSDPFTFRITRGHDRHASAARRCRAPAALRLQPHRRHRGRDAERPHVTARAAARRRRAARTATSCCSRRPVPTGASRCALDDRSPATTSASRGRPRDAERDVAHAHRRRAVVRITGVHDQQLVRGTDPGRRQRAGARFVVLDGAELVDRAPLVAAVHLRVNTRAADDGRRSSRPRPSRPPASRASTTSG